ncbi:MAG: hypothetical protein GY847_10445 [Proteobacteria bacterium]|nr:hypothetical protein [Pseudomonadota bacterium]
MARINEYQANGGTFENASDAISALENYLKDVRSTLDRSSTTLDKERRYRTSISGLKECLKGIVDSSLANWKDIGLDASFVQEVEAIQKERFVKQLMFRHPVYEHVWLTDSNGNNVAEELLPFLVYELEYIKPKELIKVSSEQLNAKLNLPELRTSIKAAGDDIEVVKKEAEFVATVLNTALETRNKISTALEEFCKEHALKLEGSDTQVDSSKPKEEVKDKAKDEAQDEVKTEAVASSTTEEAEKEEADSEIEEIDITDDDISESDLNSAFSDDDIDTETTAKSEAKVASTSSRNKKDKSGSFSFSKGLRSKTSRKS